jgi:hypothetical protein
MQSLKKYFFIIVLLVAAETVTAQTNPLEAKAAYLLAEENYGKGDMRAALDYINEATAKLGTANAKICYLKIMILKEMSSKDTNAVTKLDSAILAFETAPDVADFNEEKTLEIAKIKIEQKRNAVIAKENKKYSALAIEENMMALQNKIGWRIGMPLDSAVVLHKELFDEFLKNASRKKDKIRPDEFVRVIVKGKGPVDIQFKNGFLSSYQYYVHNLFEQPDYEQSRKVLKQTLDDLTTQFGYLPEPQFFSSASVESQSKITRYTWKSTRVILLLDLQETTSKSSGWAVYKMNFSANTQL